MNGSISLAWACPPALTCALAIVGCGGGAVDHDAGPIAADAAISTHDAWSLEDAGPSPEDAAIVLGDSAVPVMPEQCTGGLDEDGDRRADCDDDDCWTDERCIAIDVARVGPSLVPCGDPIEIDDDTVDATCPTLMPSSAEIPRDCEASTASSATARVFCDADGAAAALWIEERVTTPRSSRMISDRMFETTSFERAGILDWERQESGASARESPGTGAGREIGDHASSEHTGFRVISVRAVAPGDVVMRLLGMNRVVSVIDIDAGRSTDTRAALRTGGIRIVLPRP